MNNIKIKAMEMSINQMPPNDRVQLKIKVQFK